MIKGAKTYTVAHYFLVSCGSFLFHKPIQKFPEKRENSTKNGTPLSYRRSNGEDNFFHWEKRRT